jgi:hypothetical protein
VIDVVGEPDLDAARGRVGQRAVDDQLEWVGQPDVVDCDFERLLRR